MVEVFELVVAEEDKIENGAKKKRFSEKSNSQDIHASNKN